MVRITDVARHAGVSPSTVSYALSGKRPISGDPAAPHLTERASTAPRSAP